MHPNIAKEVMEDFPLKLADNVFYCGFNSPKSYGGNAYFIVDPSGNWLVDAPKFLPQLMNKFEAMGGVSKIFLTHRDDVADARLYANHFGASCIIHRRDLSALRDAEIVIDGDADVAFGNDFKVVPTPGHTAGHCALLYQNKFLFTGDHMAWDRSNGALESWPDVCWYSWDEQIQSIRRLADYTFEWVLPGHGDRVHLSQGEMHDKLQDLIVHVGA
jgi:glyoxylase-like metal-dependent hydrolase (beta-lactamase superfamily II)